MPSNTPTPTKLSSACKSRPAPAPFLFRTTAAVSRRIPAPTTAADCATCASARVKPKPNCICTRRQIRERPFPLSCRYEHANRQGPPSCSPELSNATVMSADPIRVSVIEDNPEELALYAEIVDAAPGLCCVSGHPDAAHALRHLPEIRPDVL